MRPTAELVAYRIYSQPKIQKPRKLCRLSPAFSLILNKSKRKNHVYIVGDDVYVYFFDLFSRAHGFPDPKDMELPTSALQRKYPDEFKSVRREKFIYADGWSTILDRNEGYVRFPGLVEAIRRTGYLPALVGELVEAFCELSRKDSGFDPVGFDCMSQRFADYDRLLNDMTGNLFMMIKNSQL